MSGIGKLVFPALLLALAPACSKPGSFDDFSLQSLGYTAIADFGDPGSGAFSVWDFFPDDARSFARADKYDGALRIMYDINSEDYARNGVSIDLGGRDFGEYSTIHIKIKGAIAPGFPEIINLALTNNNGETGRVDLAGLTREWKIFSIPLKEFSEINDYSSMKDLQFLFCSQSTVPGTGVMYVEGLYLEKKEHW